MAQWLPVFADRGFPPHAQALRRMARGLASLSLPVRVDRLGTRELPLDLLRVHCPQDRAEAAEQWLCDLAFAGEQRGGSWASDLDQFLVCRWPELLVWTGTFDERRAIETCLSRAFRPGYQPRQAFAAWTTNGMSIDERARSEGTARIDATARSAVAIALQLRDVEVEGPDPRDDPHAWITLFACNLIDPSARAEWQRAHGLWKEALHGNRLRSCAVTIGSSTPPCVLLTVHDDGGDLESGQTRVAAATGRHLPALPLAWIHRCPADETEKRSARLQAALPDVSLSWEKSSADGFLGAPLLAVDLVLAALREPQS